MATEPASSSGNRASMDLGSVPNNEQRKRVVCVFCGASPGNSPLHMEAARALARVLHENGISLVYGGGTVGIMGEVAKTLVSLSGPDAVHGIIPKALVKFERDWGQDKKISETIDQSRFGRTTVVADMHTRKALMAKEADLGFIALPGGFGTLEELAEVTTWNQLGIHSKGVVVLNVDGYYDGLLQWIRNAIESGFIAESNKNIMVEAKSAEDAVNALQNYQVSKGVFDLQWDEK